MKQLWKIDLSNLTNPCKNLEKSVAQFWQIYINIYRNPCINFYISWKQVKEVHVSTTLTYNNLEKSICNNSDKSNNLSKIKKRSDRVTYKAMIRLGSDKNVKFQSRQEACKRRSQKCILTYEHFFQDRGGWEATAEQARHWGVHEEWVFTLRLSKFHLDNHWHELYWPLETRRN